MLKIALCEDSLEERSHVSQLLNLYIEQHTEITAKLSVFDSAPALLAVVEEEGGFDLYILDVIMPELTGIELGVKLRELEEWGAIIYLSVSPEYAVDSYRARAFYYLVKPVVQDQFFSVLDQAIVTLKRKKAARISVKTNRGVKLISLDDILYAELINRSVRYHLAGGERIDSMTLRISFQDAMAPLLHDPRFILCGSSFAVNLYYVISADHHCFHLDGGAQVPLPRRYAAQAKQALENYWLR